VACIWREAVYEEYILVRSDSPSDSWAVASKQIHKYCANATVVAGTRVGEGPSGRADHYNDP